MSGNRLLRDGKPWVPHAVQMIAFVAPPSAQAGPFAAAYKHYLSAGQAEFNAMRAWGADSVRMQLSQPGADPGNTTGRYDPTFVATYVDAVRKARQAGLTVIVSIQDERQSGEPSPAPLPNAVTNAVWKNLIQYFKGDDGILLEMFNEPQPLPNPNNWTEWAKKMNAIVKTIRDKGATNTLIADGLNFAETLDGVIPLADPLGNVAYSSHPYFHNEIDQHKDAWYRKFGNAATSLPVIIGEWTTQTKSRNNNYYCAGTTPDAALRFLHYLEMRQIGLVAVAYDFALPKLGGIVTDFEGRPTTYANHIQCGDSGFGPGRLVQYWYQNGSVPPSLR